MQMEQINHAHDFPNVKKKKKNKVNMSQGIMKREHQAKQAT